MLASVLSEVTFSQSLKPSNASGTAVVLRRRFFDIQRDQLERQKQQRERQQNWTFQRHNLHIPSSVRCPSELSPIESAMGGHVPFAAALHDVRSRCLPTKLNFDSDDFEWLDTDQLNNSSGESSSRKVAAKEAAKREMDNFFFLFFRIRKSNYFSLVSALRQSAPDQSIFNEENVDRWTQKFKFKIRRAAPLKKALSAFSCRLGIEGDNCVIYCSDGFYGDAFTGRYFTKNEVPNARIMPANTCLATGLKNGFSIFVSRVTKQEHTNAFSQLQLDLLNYYVQDDGEEDEQAALTVGPNSGEPKK